MRCKEFCARTRTSKNLIRTKKEQRVKRIILVMTVGVFLLTLAAGVATAALNEIRCADQNPSTQECNGTQKSDKIIGTKHRDEIFAKRGNDLVYGRDGNDEIHGSYGDDTLYGGSGDDRIFDNEIGGDTDKVYGQSGNDFINVADGDSKDSVDCGSGRDTVKFDKGDNIASNCERRQRVNSPTSTDAQQYADSTEETSAQ